MQWWREAVVYQVYVRSFSDADGDGVGDLDGIRSRLGYLELLGVDAIWLTPFYTSPMADHGYDVADPRDVDPVFGDLAAFDTLVEATHEHGLKLVVDLVPNHTSSEHEWFRAALDAAPGSPERARYHFRAGRRPDGAQPPNNWTSVFGGPAWTRVHAADGEPGEWYLHLFSAEQPDLNWTNPEVWADLEKTLRFWLDRGVDGFRIDVAHGMSKPDGLPDSMAATRSGLLPGGRDGDPRFDHDDVHDVHRMIRAVLDHYPGRMAVGEVSVRDDARFARYLRPDELHLGFNFRLLRAPFEAAAVRDAVEHSLASVAGVAATPTWAIAGHDVSRPVTRYGGGELGTARARAMALVTLALPGTVFVYNGEELGLPDVDLPDEALQDPVWERSGHTERGRDAFRVPMPWEGGAPGYGFTEGVPWLPMPPEYGELTVAEQLEDTASTLSLVRRAVELRRRHPGFTGTELEWFGAPVGCLAFRRAGTTLVCALNTSDQAVALPPGDVLLTSGPLDDGLLPPDTAAWLA
ncbi:MAG: alpha-glucosidase [Pseudonocardiales bacterium]|uniref:glycoside hydrolase family 13 protein n=1 Tax=Pseudonocardia sp. TaxID=60912 RepID=UPI002632423F|nr:glycoside hydrolase family 13 protein [Pseudonocardia sp.]MCW2719531.1 alpha amylase catalytic region [Pseudonocardia sp.]MDT7706469.1 alpha-glucosidase [Pseudonocardiales bacterium]